MSSISHVIDQITGPGLYCLTALTSSFREDSTGAYQTCSASQFPVYTMQVSYLFLQPKYILYSLPVDMLHLKLAYLYDI